MFSTLKHEIPGFDFLVLCGYFSDHATQAIETVILNEKWKWITSLKLNFIVLLKSFCVNMPVLLTAFV